MFRRRSSKRARPTPRRSRGRYSRTRRFGRRRVHRRRFGGGRTRSRYSHRRGGKASFARRVTSIAVRSMPLNRYESIVPLAFVGQAGANAETVAPFTAYLETESPTALLDMFTSLGQSFGAASPILERFKLAKKTRTFYNVGSFPVYFRTAKIYPRRDMGPTANYSGITTMLSYYSALGTTVSTAYRGITITSQPYLSMPFINPFLGFDFQKMFKVRSMKTRLIQPACKASITVKKRFGLNRKIDINTDLNAALFIARKGQCIHFYQFWGYAYFANEVAYGGQGQFAYGPYTIIGNEHTYASYFYAGDQGVTSLAVNGFGLAQFNQLDTLNPSYTTTVIAPTNNTIPAAFGASAIGVQIY